MRSRRVLTDSSFTLSLASWIEFLIPSLERPRVYRLTRPFTSLQFIVNREILFVKIVDYRGPLAISKVTMALGSRKTSDEQTSRLRACTSDLKAADQITAEKNTCDALGLLHPEGPRLKAWNVVIHTLVMWSSFWVTLEFAFLPNPSPAILYFDSAVCLFFLANTAITFKRAFRCSRSLRLVTSRSAIALRYAKGGLLFDIVSSIPYNLIYYWANGTPASGALGYVFRGLPCLRLYRIVDFYHALSALGTANQALYFSIRVFKLVLNIVLASHLFAVAYFFLTLMEPDPENTWIGQGIGPDWPEQSVFLQYVAALWWSIFVITSIGPAYTSVTTAEQIFSCFYALFGMATLAYTLGTLTLLMVKQSSKTMQYHEDMAALKAYVARTNLPADVERQLKQQLRVQLQMHKSDASSFLSSIPHHLRVTVSRQLYLPIVENLDGFRLCSKAFLKQLVSEMDVETVMRNDIVTSEGDVATHLYIVLSGKLVREDGPAAALQSGFSTFLTAGSVFGKTAVMCDVLQLFTVRALEHSQLLRLSKSAFSAIARAYPADSSILFTALKQNIDGPESLIRTPSELAVSQGLARSQPSWKGFGATPEEPAEGKVPAGRMLLESVAVDSGDEDQVSRVCGAAASGRADQLVDLLTATPSLAHCHDYNGRTPLHVASAHGHVSCINTILKCKNVDVNALDRGGSTPLLEAVKNGHTKAAEALQAAGAALLLKDPGVTLCRLAASAATEGTATNTTSASAASKRGGSSVEYLKWLLAAGADVNAQDHAGCTALHVACANRSIAVAKLLIAHGADAHLEDMSGNTAYDLAKAGGSADLLNELDSQPPTPTQGAFAGSCGDRKLLLHVAAHVASQTNLIPPLPSSFESQEDRKLLLHVAAHGTRQWRAVVNAGLLPGRDSKACCNRFIVLKRKFFKRQEQRLQSEATLQPDCPNEVAAASGAACVEPSLEGGVSHDETTGSHMIFYSNPKSGCAEPSLEGGVSHDEGTAGGNMRHEGAKGGSTNGSGIAGDSISFPAPCDETKEGGVAHGGTSNAIASDGTAGDGTTVDGTAGDGTMCVSFSMHGSTSHVAVHDGPTTRGGIASGGTASDGIECVSVPTHFDEMEGGGMVHDSNSHIIASDDTQCWHHHQWWWHTGTGGDATMPAVATSRHASKPRAFTPPPSTPPPITPPPSTLPPITPPPSTPPPSTLFPITLPPITSLSSTHCTIAPLVISLAAIAPLPNTLPLNAVPPITLPPITLPPITLPPITLPPITLPPITLPLPPITLPLITFPPITPPAITPAAGVTPTHVGLHSKYPWGSL
ncbi:unnamed protein product [Closterium sp. Yama58-4]|nr:unnamed protein product [Closterium sp. Yama58-4]